ncbi:polyprenyl synthetase family protein [Candidatus Margulisiibacteriota bacterium]
MIDKALKKYLPEDDSSISCAMRYSVMAGGKRFRPKLMLMVAKLLGKKPGVVLPAACAVELIHTFTLIHDDLPAMDDSDLRRGKATCHKKFGEDIALLAGDALNTLAFKVIADNLPSVKVAAVSSELASALLDVVEGQRMDIEHEKDVTKIHLKKTAALIIGSVRVAAILSGANKKQLKALTTCAREMGLAFQIADDVLDVTSNSKKLGKPAGTDQQNKKTTYPGVFGVIRSKQLALKHCNQAIKALKIFGKKAKILIELADFAVRRLR